MLCNDEPQLVTLVPAEQLLAPELGPIDVEVMDADGNTLDIPYDVTGRFERTVRLRDDAAYRLVDVRSEGGEQISERSVRFGLEGGKVVYVLEPIKVDLLQPAPEPNAAPARPLELPAASAEVLAYPAYTLSRDLEHSSLVACQSVTVTLSVTNTGSGVGKLHPAGSRSGWAQDSQS